jgi:hypothetical protein
VGTKILATVKMKSENEDVLQRMDQKPNQHLLDQEKSVKQKAPGRS